jgi:spore photoproduct lyase
MNSLTFYKEHFTRVYVLHHIRHHPVVQRVKKTLDTLPFFYIHKKEEIPGGYMNQHTLFINSAKEVFAGTCPGSKGHVCCNYLTIDLYEGCTIGCTYCIMKSYLNFSPITVNINTGPTILRVLSWAEKNPGTILRVGTGEVGDSLLFDPLFRLSEEFVTAFAPHPSIFFELKTKTNYIEHLLDLPHKGNCVIGFSLNPPKIAKKEEPFAASLDERIQAAHKAEQAGFLIAFHFDPIIRFPGWEKAYAQVIHAMGRIPGSKIPWISLGTFRYTPKLRDKMEARWFLYDEFVPCRDNKYRYIQRVRKNIYHTIVAKIREIFPRVPLYMCMESPAMWEYIFGKKPGKIDNLCAIFNRADIF